MKLIRLMAVGLLMGSAPTTILAQDEASTGPGYINFRIQTVKPDRLDQWESLRKEISENARASGLAFYHVYQRVRGPASGFVIVSPATGIGEPGAPFDEPPAFPVSDNWLNGMQSILESQSLITLQTYPDLATVAMGPMHPSENFAHFRIRTAAVGRSADFEAWLRDDLIPGLKEAGAGDVRNARVVLGGSPRTWVTVSFVPGWPEPVVDLDPRILERVDDLVATQLDYFYSFREDLSFTAD